MRTLLKDVKTMVWKDIVAEARNKEMVTSILTFAILILVIFNFALRLTPQIILELAPGILWITFIFSGLLGLTRLFVVEQENNTIHGLLLSPVSRENIYVSKAISTFLFMFVSEIIVIPLFSILFNVSLFNLLIFAVIILTTIGFASIGTFFSAIATNTKSREIMMPMLFVPIVVPIIIAAVISTGIVIQGGGWDDIYKWVQLIVVFDILSVVFSMLAFEQTLQE
ncbi:MAG: heme ABC transporter permease CcmB [Chloroflexi bacterium]|nr:heme ABC transporter permease CcmB [Chloroflexota bacterium]